MKEKTIYVHPNGTAIARYHNRRIMVISYDDRILLQFTRYAPFDTPKAGETFNRGIITTTIAISKEGAWGLLQALGSVLKQQNHV